MIKLLGFGTILSKLIAFIIPFLLKAPVNHYTNYKSNRFLFAYKKKSNIFLFGCLYRSDMEQVFADWNFEDNFHMSTNKRSIRYI